MIIIIIIIKAQWIACTDGEYYVCRPQSPNGANSDCGSDTQVGGLHNSLDDCLHGNAWCSCDFSCATYDSGNGDCCASEGTDDSTQEYFFIDCPAANSTA